MKRIRYLAAAAITLAQIASAANSLPPANAGDDYIRSVQEFCAQAVASGDFPGLSWGDCFSFNVTPVEGFNSIICNAFKVSGVLSDWGFSSYPDCVQNFLVDRGRP